MLSKMPEQKPTDVHSYVGDTEFEFVEGDRHGWEAYETEEVIITVHERLAYQLFYQAWVHNLSSIIVAICAAVATWRVVDHTSLLIWLAVFVLVYSCRWLISFNFHKAHPKRTAVYKWIHLQFGAIIASALVYSAPVVFLWPENAPLEQMVWVITLTATPALAVARDSVWKYADLPFICLTLLSIVVRLFFNDGFPYTILGILGIIYGLTLVEIGRVMYKTNLENLLTGVKNQQLNQLLAYEVEERERTYAIMRKQEQELAQAKRMESIGILSAGVAHEINTPLQFISSNLHFIASGVKSIQAFMKRVSFLKKSQDTACCEGALCESIDSIRNEYDIDYFLDEMMQAKNDTDEGVTRISKIIEALQLHAGSECAAVKTVNLNEAVENSVLLSHHLWQDLCFIDKCYADDLPEINCAIKEINQAIMGLLINAIHAIQDRKKQDHFEGRIAIQTSCDGDRVRLSISDNGCGIPERIWDRIFEDFFTTREVGEGAGQGLSYAYRVIDKCGGTITFTSEENVGTTFHIELPC